MKLTEITRSSAAETLQLPLRRQPSYLGILAFTSVILATLHSLSLHPEHFGLRWFESIPQFSVVVMILSLILAAPLLSRIWQFSKTGEGFEFVAVLALWGGAFSISSAYRDFSLELATWILAFGLVRLSFFRFFELNLIERCLHLKGEAAHAFKRGHLFQKDSDSVKRKEFLAKFFVVTGVVLSFGLFFLWSQVFEKPDLAIQAAFGILAVNLPAVFSLSAMYTEKLFRLRALESLAVIHDRNLLEKAAELTHITFDKTGTLTEGEYQISQIKTVENLSHKDAIRWAASLENGIDHPLSQALLREAQKLNLDLIECESRHYETSKGISGTIKKSNKEHQFLFGSLLWLFENDVDSTMIPDDLRWEAEGTEDSVLWLAMDGQPIAILSFNDSTRTGAEEAVRELGDEGFEVGLITADSESVARSLAKRLKLKFYHFEIHPAEKPTVIARLSEKKKKGMDFIFPKLMFVGDGIQDAASVEAAYVGVSLGRDQSFETSKADVQLLRNDLQDVVSLVKLMKQYFFQLNLNHSLSFFYHLIFLALASGILTHFLGLQISPLAFCFMSLLFSIIVILLLNRSAKSA